MECPNCLSEKVTVFVSYDLFVCRDCGEEFTEEDLIC